MIIPKPIRLVVCAALTCCFAGADPILYTVTDLGNFIPQAINSAGQIAGNISGSRAAIYSNGTVTALFSSSVSSFSEAINSAGDITGGYFTNGFPNGGMFLSSGGILTQFPASTGIPITGAGINDSGEIVGAGTVFLPGSDTTTVADAFVEVDGTMAYEPFALQAMQFTGINNAGQIVGISGDGQAFVYTAGSMILLGPSAGIAAGQPMPAPQINSSGQVTLNRGYTNTGLLYSNGVFTQLGPLNNSLVFGLNDLGQAVGMSSGHAVLYAAGIVTDLNTEIDPSLNITLGYASGINNSGQIIANGGGHGYLLTPLNSAPTPEPATAALLSIGLIGFALKSGASWLGGFRW